MIISLRCGKELETIPNRLRDSFAAGALGFTQ
jgi:hypothetical protein